MIKQIEESIDFDCNDYGKPVFTQTKAFLYSQIDSGMKNIKYHSKGAIEEQQRIDGRRKWLTDLGDSLGVKI